MKINLNQKLSSFLGINYNQLNEIIRKAPFSYKKYKIPKKKNGERSIYHPSKETKAIQYALIHILLKELPIHKIAMAYIRGIKSPIKKTAELHSKYKYTVNADLKDFFPSIVPEDLFQAINDFKSNNIFTADEKITITNSLFINIYHMKFLAIGAPSSPIISNIVMYKHDNNILTTAQSLTSDFALTRYADDITFSCNETGKCNRFVDLLNENLSKIDRPKLFLNHDKTRFSSKGTRRYVLGLSIMPNGNISIGRKRKRMIHHFLNESRYKKYSDKKYNYLKGMLAFILDVEPDFYNRLVLKYKEDVFNRIYGSYH